MLNGEWRRLDFVSFVPFVTFVVASAATALQREGERQESGIRYQGSGIRGLCPERRL
jgi:hypothetical protein